MDFRNNPDRRIRHWLSIPFIYLMALPIVLLHVLIEVYHSVCFPLYGIKKVNRADYVRMDRHRLKYLRWHEKLNCAYCGYANGILRYSTEIAAQTEKYWCGIKHQEAKGFREPAHHKSFLKYGDEQAYKKALKQKKR